MGEKYDFCGYATKNDLLCADGRTIRKDAFKDNHKTVVPLIWNHRHDDPEMIIGHALLENRKDGVYMYGKFNDTEKGELSKKLVKNGDIKGLSIYANQLKQQNGNVLHGVIREVSVVTAGANPGAMIDLCLAHGDETTGEVYAFLVGDEYTELCHSDEGIEAIIKEETEDMGRNENDVLEHADEPKGKDLKEVFDTLNEEQKTVVYAMLAAVAAKEKEDNDEEDEDDDMKHNVFEGCNENPNNYLQHSDEEAILDMAKNTAVGSFQNALDIYCDENELQHDAISSGFLQTNADGNVTWLFPEYKDVRPGAPELVTSDQGWIGTVLNKVHKSPISRIRTSQVDIRNIDTLRARGYKKGKQKAQTGNFALARRTTDPQTVYVKSALHRDDIIDITDFDYVQYLYNIDKLQLNEELATAIMLGDGRNDQSDDKISAEHIRPIWTDDDLYTIHVDLDVTTARTKLQGDDTDQYFGDNFVYAEAMIETVLYAREDFKGTGTPDMYITPHMLNVMLLARDRNGRRIYSSKAELASAFNVGNVYTVEQFANKTRTVSVTVEGVTTTKTKKLLAIIANLADYSLGATKGGQITHFTQFDIDFNQQKSLLETRCSGALTRIYSAIAIEEEVTG